MLPSPGGYRSAPSKARGWIRRRLTNTDIVRRAGGISHLGEKSKNTRTPSDGFHCIPSVWLDARDLAPPRRQTRTPQTTPSQPAADNSVTQQRNALIFPSRHPTSPAPPHNPPDAHRARDGSGRPDRIAPVRAPTLLTSGRLSPSRSPRVRTLTFASSRQALPLAFFVWNWALPDPAGLPPVSRPHCLFVFLRSKLRIPLLPDAPSRSGPWSFASVSSTASGCYFANNKSMPMPGTLESAR
jgi:hypothetical protein